MNAPHAVDAMASPLLLGLIGNPGSGRKAIADYLKFKHGFARHSLRQPVFDSLTTLYGASPMDVFFEQDRVIDPLGKTTNQLAAALESHVSELAGGEIFMRRLVERATIRGDWGQRDLVISDISNALELEWFRRCGGKVLWVRRAAQHEPPLSNVQRLALAHWHPGDCAIVNEPPASMIDQVDQSLAWIKARSAIADPV